MTKLYQQISLLFLMAVAVCIWCQRQDTSQEFFKITQGHALSGQVMATHVTRDVIECGMMCARNHTCRSYNYYHGDGDAHVCELNGAVRGNLVQNEHVTYYEKDPCVPNPCSPHGACVYVTDVADERYYRCNCTSGYTGDECKEMIRGRFYSYPALSCRDLVTSGAAGPDGMYWVRPNATWNPYRAFCDMTTDGGGWLLVSNIEVSDVNNLPSLSMSTDPLEYTTHADNKPFNFSISPTLLIRLLKSIGFQQMRFHCRKQKKRTFDVFTKNKDARGYAALHYFTLQSDQLAKACDSFARGQTDDSILSINCKEWGRDGIAAPSEGEWGHQSKINNLRLYDDVAHINGSYRWAVVPPTMMCDDDTNDVTVGDFWRVYVR